MCVTGDLGTCTLTVAFLRDLPPWPRKPPAPFPLRYDTSYLQLYWLAESLHDECLIRQRKFGWLAPSESFLGFSVPRLGLLVEYTEVSRGCFGNLFYISDWGFLLGDRLSGG